VGAKSLTPGISLPAGQWVLVGLPAYARGQLLGADLIYRYSPTDQTYVVVAGLEPGEGGWALSTAGARLTFQQLATPRPSRTPLYPVIPP